MANITLHSMECDVSVLPRGPIIKTCDRDECSRRRQLLHKLLPLPKAFVGKLKCITWTSGSALHFHAEKMCEIVTKARETDV